MWTVKVEEMRGLSRFSNFSAKLERTPRWLCRVNTALKAQRRDFPGGTVVKNPPVNAWDTGAAAKTQCSQTYINK